MIFENRPENNREKHFKRDRGGSGHCCHMWRIGAPLIEIWEGFSLKSADRFFKIVYDSKTIPFALFSKTNQWFISFLDASTHLYKRVCPSGGPSVGHAFVKKVENGWCKLEHSRPNNFRVRNFSKLKINMRNMRKINMRNEDASIVCLPNVFV